MGRILLFSRIRVWISIWVRTGTIFGLSSCQTSNAIFDQGSNFKGNSTHADENINRQACWKTLGLYLLWSTCRKIATSQQRSIVLIFSLLSHFYRQERIPFFDQRVHFKCPPGKLLMETLMEEVKRVVMEKYEFGFLYRSPLIALWVNLSNE